MKMINLILTLVFVVTTGFLHTSTYAVENPEKNDKSEQSAKHDTQVVRIEMEDGNHIELPNKEERKKGNIYNLCNSGSPYENNEMLKWLLCP